MGGFDVAVDPSVSETATDRRELLRARNVMIVAAMAVANVSNYAFQIVTGRFLGPREYGLLGGLMAVTTVIAVSTSSVQTVTAAEVASGRSDPTTKRAIDPFTRSTLVLCAALAVIGLALSPLLASFFDVGALPVMVLAAYFAPAAAASIATGRFQGMERFSAMAWYSTALAVGKLAVGLGILAVGLHVTGLMFGLVGSSALIAAVGLWVSRDAGAVSSHVFSPDVRRAFVALTLFWVIVSTDVPLARAYLSEDQAGLYAAAAVMGKAVLWLPAVVAQLAFPRLASNSRRGEAVTPLMLRALSLAFALAVVAVVALYVLGDQLVAVLYGDEFDGAADIAWRLGVASIPLGIANLLVFHHVARESSRFLVYMLVAALAQPVALVAVHDTPTSFALVVGLTGTALMCALVPNTGWRRVASRVLRRPHIHPLAPPRE